MRITALVENTTDGELKAKHGLSLYIETKQHKILFDLGPDSTLFQNAAARGIDLAGVDTVIISHGHFDHGKALAQFLAVNTTAKVYVQRLAFEPYYTKVLFFKHYIGLDRSLMTDSRIVLLDGDCKIDDELSLFVVRDITRLRSDANDALCDKRGRDTFIHEQNLLISEVIEAGETSDAGKADEASQTGGACEAVDPQCTLVMGCGHTGIVNILARAKEYRPGVRLDCCIGGYHLYNPVTRKTVSHELLDGIACELAKYPATEFYTCHCTGEEAYRYLASRLPNMRYLRCGDSVGRV